MLLQQSFALHGSFKEEVARWVFFTVEVVRSDICAAYTVLVVMLQEALLQVQKVCRELRSARACSTLQHAVKFPIVKHRTCMETWVS